MLKTADGRLLADTTPLSAPYFTAARSGRLLLPHCPRDGYFFYPRQCCPTCLREDWQWREAPPRATLYTFTVDRVGLDPNHQLPLPHIIALAQLDCGPRILGPLRGCAPEEVRVGMPLELVFEQFAEGAVAGFVGV